MTAPKVTVIMPVRNEAGYIETALAGVLATTTPTLEVLVVDGRSSDGTADLVRALAARDPRVRLLDNPRQVVPTALNLGIREARGEIIVRLDAHAAVGADYIPTLVAELERSGAANVGGVLETLPGAATPVAEAIAAVLSSPLGVGGASFRTGVREPTWVDTVPFGCWKRSTLQELGGFDEVMIRNQDDELNGRTLARGGRILLVPSVRIRYFARATLRGVARMYYQYGWYKPLALRKIGQAVTMRQFMPGVAVLGLSGGAAWALAAPTGWRWLGAVPWVLYTALLLLAMLRLGKGRSAVWIPIALAAVHMAYGVGSLRGVVEFLVVRRDQWGGVKDLPLSR
jgi:GT2 family glycosyltransferase